MLRGLSKDREMAHTVKIEQPNWELMNSDIKIAVSNDDGKLGEMLISKGNFEWRPAGNHKNFYRMSWTKFADFMKLNGTLKYKE